MTPGASRRKAAYVAAVTKGEGWMPWQGRESVSEEERSFRAEVERRKDEMLGSRMRMRRPVLITEREVEQARKNIRRADWAKRWFEGKKRTTEYALMGLDAGEAARGGALDLPEIYFPNWMTAILRHGSGEKGTVLSLAFNPTGFPVRTVGRDRIGVDRFPLPKVRRFERMAVRCGET